MTTMVKIVNLNQETKKLVYELFSKSENSPYVNINENLNQIFGENFSEPDGVPVVWMDDNVGSKSLEIEICDNVEGSDIYELILRSAWEVPTKYLVKLASCLNEINEDIAILGTYEDETFEPMGAFVFAYNYQEIEEFEEIDTEQMNDDDDYRQEMLTELIDLRDSLWDSYLEVKKEREEGF